MPSSRTAPKDLASLSPDALFDELVPPEELRALVARALAEDLGAAGDVTAEAMIPASAAGRGVVRARAAGVVCGVRVALEVLAQAAPGCRASVHAPDASRVREGDAVLSVEGPMRGLLAAERTMLNFLGHLSGISSLTARFADLVAGTRAQVLDTRKTVPGLRMLAKHAVRCGGGTNHRIGLFDAMLVKDNHVAGLSPQAMASAVAEAASRARAAHALRFVEVECDSVEQFRAIAGLPAGTVDYALLDNMDPPRLAECVRIRDAHAPRMLLEASGGVRIDSVRAIAEAGVDRISIGALTHSAPALDVALDVEAS